MSRILDNVNIFLSRLGSLRGHSQELYHARFALPHELQGLISHTLDETALLVSTTHLGGIYRVTPTRERRELGNMLVCAPPRSGKSILAMSQLLTWPHSVVVVDIKGELYQNTAGYRATLGRKYSVNPYPLQKKRHFPEKTAIT
jgi:type IV secretion system protein VirD4